MAKTYSNLSKKEKDMQEQNKQVESSVQQASQAAQAVAISPFTLAEKRDKKIKLFLWGSWGVGKTTAALQFPKPVLLDLDGGADLYGDKFKFHVLKSANLVEIKNAIAYLCNNKTEFETLVIDPITIYWELLQKHWSDIFVKRLKGRNAHKHEFYEIGPKEWSTIKADFKALFNKLMELDMHVVVTGREAVKYLNNDFTKGTDGVKFDGEKSIPYIFDTVLRLYKENGVFKAVCEKDRTEKLKEGQVFSITGKSLSGLFLEELKKAKESESK